MVYRHRAHRPALPGNHSCTSGGKQRHLRARRADRVACASAGPGLDRNGGCGRVQRWGRPDRRNSAGRRNLDCAGRKALARSCAHHGHDAHRHPRTAQRQRRRLDGKSHRRTIRRGIEASRNRDSVIMPAWPSCLNQQVSSGRDRVASRAKRCDPRGRHLVRSSRDQPFRTCASASVHCGGEKCRCLFASHQRSWPANCVNVLTPNVARR